MAQLSETQHDKTILPDPFRIELDKKIENGELEVPLLPSVASQIMAEGFGDQSDMRKLSKLIHSDPSLAGNVLKVANSVAYNPGTPIVSLQQAVLRIGMGSLKEIIISIAFGSRVFKVNGFKKEINGLWSHSIATGAYAKEVARACRINVESAFLCGLLHDVGKPVLLLTLGDIQKKLKTKLEKDLALKGMRAYHTDVGRMLAEKWKLPEQVNISIDHHHDYSAAPHYNEFAAIAYLANLLSHLMFDAMAGNEVDEEPLRNDEVLETLNLYPDDIDALIEKQDKVKEFMEAIG